MGLQILAGACIVKSNKILILQQTPNGSQPNCWGPPAGHATPGETPQETVIRETKEETNLDIELQGLIQCSLLITKEGKEYVAVFYLAKAKNIKNMKIQEEEVQAYSWASLSEIKKDKFPLRKQFLKEPLLLGFTKKSFPLTTFKITHLE